MAAAMNLEVRAAPGAMEFRAAGRRLEGLAAIFGVETRIGGFTEVIRRGAFSTSLGADVLALVDHDPGRLLARTKAGTLRLAEDSRGLAFSLDVPDTSLGRDVLALVQRGDVGGMSFGFTVPKGGDVWQGRRRELLSVELREVSVVHAWPAYDGTVVQARAVMPPAPRVMLARRWLETLR